MIHRKEVYNLTFNLFSRYYSLTILLTGLVIPLTLGVVSSAAILFVYNTSSFGMNRTHAMFCGVGQTVVHSAFGYFKFLATL